MRRPIRQSAMHKILIIDDEPMNIEFAVKALGECQSPVFHVAPVCGHLRDGLDQIKSDPDWAVVILDMMMPVPLEWQDEVQSETAGLKVLREARDFLIENKIPVIVYTNRDEIGEKLRAFNMPSGALSLVPKNSLFGSDFPKLVKEVIANAVW